MIGSVMLAFALGVCPPQLSVDTVVVLYTAGISGALDPMPASWINPEFPPMCGGAGSLVKLVEEYRDKYPLLLVSAGGFFHPLDSVPWRRVVNFFNKAGYDAVCVGINELHLGMDTLKVAIRESEFPWLCANLYSRNRERFLPRYMVVEKAGVKIGIFGVLTEYADMFSTTPVAREFVFTRELEAMEDVVRELKVQGVDLVVMLSHLGWKHDSVLVKEVSGIDVVVSGFDGWALREPYEDPVNHTVILRTYDRLGNLGMLKLFVDRDTKTLVGYEGRLLSLLEDESPSDTLWEER